METSIPAFYNGKSVFITGGMGFLGKVLVEKLLRSCPGIENVYLLVRSKKNKSVSDRREELISSKVFDILREKDPKSFEKIVLIEGDVTSLGLGISKENRELLCEKVSIVINSAATVKFDEPLRVAVNTNLRSLQELIKMSREMKNLKSFVHISTAYTNWFEENVKEEVYRTQFDPNYIIQIANSKSDEKLMELKPMLLGKHINTYTFTKALAEDLAFRESSDLPIAIIRPSTVGASMKEPHVGWTDSYSASTPYVDLISRGAFRTFNISRDNIFDLIPVDMVINLVITASWNVANRKLSNTAYFGPEVYFSSTSSSNPIKTKKFAEICRDIGRTKPSDMLMWYPQTRLYQSRLFYRIDMFLTHSMPAYMMDILKKLKGEEPKFTKMHKKIYKGFEAVRFISTSPIKFEGKNYEKLMASMSETDRKEFYFNPQNINWKSYLEDYYFGVRKFILNEKRLDSVVGRKKLVRFKYANFIMTTSAVGISLFAAKQTGNLFF